MKIFEFPNGQKLNVTTNDYDVLKDALSKRFSGIKPGLKPLIEQISESIEVNASGFITKIICESSVESALIVNRLVLNQILKTTNFQDLEKFKK